MDVRIRVGGFRQVYFYDCLGHGTFPRLPFFGLP
jgi:hypothetical protein